MRVGGDVSGGFVSVGSDQMRTTMDTACYLRAHLRRPAAPFQVIDWRFNKMAIVAKTKSHASDC